MAAEPMYRIAQQRDVAAMMAIRGGARENRLVSVSIDEADYVRAMTVDGRAWVCEVAGEVVGFCCGRVTQGDVWALFVREEFEGRGIGSTLLALVEDWLFAQGLASIWLATAPGTRAEALYRRRGWTVRGVKASGELDFVRARRRRPDPTTRCR